MKNFRFVVYIRQSWQLMKMNRFYTAVYIAGTALSIALVMVIAIFYYIKTADIAPEVNRSRMLHVNGAATLKEGRGGFYASLSYRTVKECFYSLETPECVTALGSSEAVFFELGDVFASVAGKEEKEKVNISCVDDNFWKVFRFSFIEGMPFAKEEFESGIRKAVISRSLKRRLFGAEEAVGRDFLINGLDYYVSGVVEDVSMATQTCYADLWVPYTTVSTVYDRAMGEGISGSLSVYILAKSTSDYTAIKDEINRKVAAYNDGFNEFKFEILEGHPQTVTYKSIQELDRRSKYSDIVRRYLLALLAFLFVPAINLSGLTSSRMQERTEEVGIRKAFGASISSLINQVLTENMLLTLVGGLFGFALSCLTVWGASFILFMNNINPEASTELSPRMLFNVGIFFAAFCVCVVLNLVSSLIPVWNASRRNIIEAINDK